MALFIQQNEDRSKLQERVAAELQERAKQRALLQDRPDGVTDSQYIKGTKQTTSLAWVWMLLFAVAIAAVIWLVIINGSKN
jgi:type VI protein secretion system component VasF